MIDCDDLTSVLLVKHASLLANGLGQAFTIYVPEGYGLGFLRRLVYSGCKAIGERELLKLMLECNTRVFPHDFPETRAGKEFLSAKAFESIKTDYCSKPPSKRLNFQILRQPAPFSPQSLFPASFFKAVSVHPVSRGVPINNSLIYLPTEEDIEIICREHFGQRQNFFDDKLAFSLEEPKGRALADNLQFNAEFAAITGFEVNLSKQ